MIKRLMVGLLVGCAATSLPWLLKNYESLWPVSLLWLPGGAVAVALAGGNIHNYSLEIVLVANVVLYALGIYLYLRRRERLARR